MIGALVYLQAQSIRNRLRARLRRLKKPKYLAGALVGAAYLYFFFFRGAFAGRQRGGVLGPVSPESVEFYELMGALALFVMVLSTWILPHERAALTFTEAEIAFLFPAPVTRKTLIHYKLLRSQSAIFFTTVLLTLATRRWGGTGTAWIRAAGWWLILSTLNLHTLAASFARTRLLEHGISNLRRRITVLSALAILCAAVGVWVKASIPAPAAADFASMETIKYYAQRTLESGPALYVLYPFRLVVRPYLAQDGWTFLLACGPPFALLLAHYAWVVRSDVAFEEASLALSQKRAEIVASMRSGTWNARAGKKQKRRAPFTLRPTGMPAVAFLWKNLISAGQTFSLRTWLFVAFLAVCVGGPIGASQSGHGWMLPTAGIVTAILGGYSLFVGPAILRQDLRHDLVHADVLKMYPLRGREVVLGELLAPTAILTGVQWCLVLLSVALFSRIPNGEPIPLATRLSLGAGAAVIAPMLNLVSLLIPNASVLLFPVWMQIGREHAGGIEVIGQRLIFMLGSVLVFAFALVPAAILFGLIYLVTAAFLGALVAIPLAAVAAASVLAAEATLAIRWMGRLFERLDVSAELTR